MKTLNQTVLKVENILTNGNDQKYRNPKKCLQNLALVNQKKFLNGQYQKEE